MADVTKPMQAKLFNNADGPSVMPSKAGNWDSSVVSRATRKAKSVHASERKDSEGSAEAKAKTKSGRSRRVADRANRKEPKLLRFRTESEKMKPRQLRPEIERGSSG